MHRLSWIPALDWMRNYNREWLKGDISAGLTVGVMLIPQGMAYAMLAGLPPIHGLYAVTLPLMVYAFLGTSRQLAVGPVAMVSLLTATGVGAIAEVGTEAFLGLAVVLTLIVGVVQLLLGLFRLGFLVNLLSHPVISGFTSAAALIIGLSQLKHLLGVDLGRSHHIHEIIIAAGSRLGEINPWTFGIGLIGVGLIIGIKKVSKAVPGQLLAVVFGVLVVYLLGLHEQGVKIVGSVPSGLPGISFPSFSWEQIQALLPTALTISLVGFMESIAVAKAVQNKHKDYALVPNQELIALGAANLAGAVVQSYPVTGGFSRTAVNDQAGAKTGLASLVSAGLIVLTLLFLTPLFYFLPQAILASVIMVAVFGLIDVAEVRHLWKVDRSDFWMLAATFVATLTLGIEQGIGVGVALSLAVHIYRSMRPHLAVLGRIPGTDIFRNVNRFKGVEEYPGVLIVRFDGPLYFGNLTYFQAQLDALVAARGPELKTIVINAEGIASLDSSALHEMHNFVANQRKRGLAIRFAALIGPARDSFKKAGLVDLIGQENFFLDVAGALDGEATQRSGYVLQADV